MIIMTTDVDMLIEELAAGEHQQWADWAQNILDTEPGLSAGRKDRWPSLIAASYFDLPEEEKEKDRREVYLRSKAALDKITKLERWNEKLERFTIAICLEAGWDLKEIRSTLKESFRCLE